MATEKTITRWAVHKQGTEQFGSLCSFKSEADDLLTDLLKNIYTMPEQEKAKYRVTEVKITWTETEEISDV